MATETLVTLLMDTASTFFVYMLPVIGAFAGINFIFSWVMFLTFGVGRKTFRE